MKNEKKQEFKSFGVLTLLGLVGFSTAIIATPWNRETGDSRTENARQKAEVVGYQVVQLYREASKIQVSPGKPGERQPASVSGEHTLSPENLRSTGTMGMDPWGQPYHYRILSAPKVEGKIRILVWSAGPNKKVDTAHLEDEAKPLDPHPQYKGDDLGVLLSVSHN